MIVGDKGHFEFKIAGQSFEGQVGQLLDKSGVKLYLSELLANQGAVFNLKKIRRISVIEKYQRDLRVSERGKKTDILQLTLNSSNPLEANKILNEISRLYVLQNMERNSAEAAKSLEFLKSHNLSLSMN